MSELRIITVPLDFMGAAPLFEPTDPNLLNAAEDYCKRELADPVNFTKFNKFWITIENPVFDKDRKFVSGEVIGVVGYLHKPDVAVFRVTGPNASRATKMQTDRLHDHFADIGYRGGEVFVHVSSMQKPEQFCSGWKEGLGATDAKPADRYSVIVR